MANLDWMDTSDAVQDEGNKLRGEKLDDAKAMVPIPCEVGPYQITHFQLGTGASGLAPKTDQGVLGAPLEFGEYGGPGTSIPLKAVMVYANEDTPIAQQAIAAVYSNGLVDNKIVYVMLLDENTANGQSLNEIGLFVHNPFLKITEAAPGVGDPEARGLVNLLGSPSSDFLDTPGVITAEPKNARPVEDPGALLAAYRQFPTIEKENFFTLLFRWSIRFGANCTD